MTLSLRLGILLADYAVKMLPGILAAALAYGLLLPRRRRSLASACLLSSCAREAAMLVFWAFCGGMAILTLTPDWFDWRSILAGGVHMPFFMWGTVNLQPIWQLLGHPVVRADRAGQRGHVPALRLFCLAAVAGAGGGGGPCS